MLETSLILGSLDWDGGQWDYHSSFWYRWYWKRITSSCVGNFRQLGNFLIIKWMESEASHTLQSPPISESPNTSTIDDGFSKKRLIEGVEVKPPLPPTKRNRSPYWEHCQKETKDTSGGKIQIGVCNYCKTEILAVRGSTSGLKNHLINMCKLSPLYVVSSEKGQMMLTKETMKQGSRIVPYSFSQEGVN
ncbi:uncharacterized protein LOC125193484 [Salvia hispanica]|uniref:uncharacterized protein LOC125193484 n=1 Tax=Salvia hispanica TaxID=49212 RepID=UPI0020095A7C|nr:uncharacterized protein LOC125193484 [Salvia hispanica]